MSTIAVLTSNETGANSLIDINANFAALNSDKPEKASGTGILLSTSGVLTIAVAGDFPTLNQNTTGSSAKWTTARNLAGNSVDGSANVAFANKFIVQGTTDSGLSGAQFLGALSTGIVKNTTTTGVLSIASAGTDYYAPGSTDVAVADGGTGASSLTAYAVLCGGTTSTNPVQAIASVGSSGNVLTSNGAGALPTFQAPAGATATPKTRIVTIFETAARFTTTTAGAGSGAFSSSGMNVSSGGTAGSCNQIFTPINSNTAAYQLGSPSFSCEVYASSISAASGSGQAFFGQGNVTVSSTAGLTYTNRHIGFKIVKTGGTTSLFATQANGTTETASSALTTVADDDVLDLMYVINGSTSVDYYWRKTNSSGTTALSAATNLTTNFPTAYTGNDFDKQFQFATSNVNTSNNFNYTIASMSYER